jgi:hypothetical protein
MTCLNSVILPAGKSSDRQEAVVEARWDQCVLMGKAMLESSKIDQIERLKSKSDGLGWLRNRIDQHIPSALLRAPSPGQSKLPPRSETV